MILWRTVFNFERLYDGVDAAVVDGLADGVEGVGFDVKHAAAQEEVFLVGREFEVYGLLTHFLTAVLREACRGTGEAGDALEQTAQQRVGQSE